MIFNFMETIFCTDLVRYTRCEFKKPQDISALRNVRNSQTNTFFVIYPKLYS